MVVVACIARSQLMEEEVTMAVVVHIAMLQQEKTQVAYENDIEELVYGLILHCWICRRSRNNELDTSGEVILNALLVGLCILFIGCP